LARRNKGFVSGEKPLLSEEGIGPPLMVLPGTAMSRPLAVLTQHGAQAPSDETIEGIEFVYDLSQAFAAGAPGFLPDATAYRFPAFLAHITTARFESIAEKLETLTRFPAIPDVGLVRV
jgi:hypothetical protein